MKYRNIVYLIFATMILSFIGCEKNYEDIGRVTYFADIVIDGETTVFSPAGTAYNDAGAVATENGQEIALITDSNVDSDTPGSYTVSYSATNSDGFAKTVSRTVIIYDANLSTDDHSGTYTANVIRNGTEAYAGNPVTLTSAGIAGIYYMSDWIAGFYALGRGYGPAYAFTGVLQINASNEVIELSMTNAWGDPFDSVTGTYDPGTGEISYSASWLEGDYVFVVDMAM